jgi:uncharacterized protein HemX
MFEKHKYKILATVLILVILGAGTFYYLKKKKAKKDAEEKAALEAEKKKKSDAKDLTKDAPKPSTTAPQKPGLQVEGNESSGKPM